ncbi:MAG: ATP-binding cassette domain-containing protein [Clostridia bacterium]|nr:ATP-binding cassette domain-containing protein [Clostridia bacterium]
MEDKKILLSVRNLSVKFRVRGRVLTAIRNVSLDLYENESIAIVGESGSGKSVFTKTFAGMLETNGFISNGQLIYNDEELAATSVAIGSSEKRRIKSIHKELNQYAKLENGAELYKQIVALKDENKKRYELPEDVINELEDELRDCAFKKTELYNLRQTLDRSIETERYNEVTAEIRELATRQATFEQRKKNLIAQQAAAANQDTAYNTQYQKKLASLQTAYETAIRQDISREARERNEDIAKEIYLSVGRYGASKRNKFIKQLLNSFRLAMKQGLDLYNEEVRNTVFDSVVFRVKLLRETPDRLHGTCILDLAKIHFAKDWNQIRGGRIATVFQDPMTSLNPIITIGKQITSVILKHQKCSELEARARALELMKKVGIPNAENRFDDYPFQYSGGMRQRIVIAIALSCQPKILICDEPTTALDVTIQAQILKLIKDLQKEFKYTIVFITHDLGVVANIADRVAVLYAGQIVELGKVEEIFYDPRHPYTWALLSSLPQLAQKNTKLYSISGTPPSLYNEIVGDAFAPRNPHCLKIDTLKEPPMFRVTDTHYAKTWLLDPRSPKISKPEAIVDIHEKLMSTLHM